MDESVGAKSILLMSLKNAGIGILSAFIFYFLLQRLISYPVQVPNFWDWIITGAFLGMVVGVAITYINQIPDNFIIHAAVVIFLLLFFVSSGMFLLGAWSSNIFQDEWADLSIAMMALLGAVIGFIVWILFGLLYATLGNKSRFINDGFRHFALAGIAGLSFQWVNVLCLIYIMIFQDLVLQNPEASEIMNQDPTVWLMMSPISGVIGIVNYLTQPIFRWLQKAME